MLPPGLVDVLLSPLLVLEMVLAAVLRSGSALLLPAAALGALLGWALKRWLPHFDHSTTEESLGYLPRWTKPEPATLREIANPHPR